MNRWLRAILLDMLERYSDETVEALGVAITTLTGLADPGMLEEQFAPWVDAYGQLLEEYRSTGGSQVRTNSSVCLEELQEQP